MLFLLWIVPIFEPLCHCLVIQFLKCCDYQVTAKVELRLELQRDRDRGISFPVAPFLMLQVPSTKFSARSSTQRFLPTVGREPTLSAGYKFPPGQRKLHLLPDLIILVEGLSKCKGCCSWEGVISSLETGFSCGLGYSGRF